MLGRLPLRYRVTVWVIGLISFGGVGAWLAHTTDTPLMWSSGAALAVLLGALAIASFLHLLADDPRRDPQPAHVRSTKRAR